MPKLTLTRDLETRENSGATRKKSWSPPNLLPDPASDPDYVYRYVRKSTLGVEDPANISVRFREGWVPVRREDHPEVVVSADKGVEGSTNIEIGGLILCKMPREDAVARREFYENMAKEQLKAVDNNLMRESHPRMPINRPEKSTRVTFGGGSKARQED